MSEGIISHFLPGGSKSMLPNEEGVACYNLTGQIIMRSDFVERKGKLEELDRSFDLEFWQSQLPQARFEAAWELIQHAWVVKGNDVRQLRLQRSVEAFQRIRG
jgi:hypothetical protein